MDLQKLEKSDESKRKSDPKRFVKAKLAETKAGCGRVRQGAAGSAKEGRHVRRDLSWHRTRIRSSGV